MATGEEMPPPVVAQASETSGGDQRERVDQIPRDVAQTALGSMRELSRRVQRRDVDGAGVRRISASWSAARVPGANIGAPRQSMDHVFSYDGDHSGQRDLSGRESWRIGGERNVPLCS